MFFSQPLYSFIHMHRLWAVEVGAGGDTNVHLSHSHVSGLLITPSLSSLARRYKRFYHFPLGKSLALASPVSSSTHFTHCFKSHNIRHMYNYNCTHNRAEMRPARHQPSGAIQSCMQICLFAWSCNPAFKSQINYSETWRCSLVLSIHSFICMQVEFLWLW